MIYITRLLLLLLAVVTVPITFLFYAVSILIILPLAGIFHIGYYVIHGTFYPYDIWHLYVDTTFPVFEYFMKAFK